MFAFGRLLGCFEGYTVYGLSAYTFKASTFVSKTLAATCVSVAAYSACEASIP